MKRHDIKNSEIDRFGGQVPEYTLCIYEAEFGDLWSGWMAAEAGWSGGQSLPGQTVSTYAEALTGWVAKHPKPSSVA
jgi:hypothetical protein